jgi:hypothetical protein
MHELVDRLEKKGWSRKEIIRALESIKKAKRNKANDIIFIEKRIFWVLIAVILAANFAVSVALLPILVVLNGFMLYFSIAVIGIVFGLLFELVIRGMEHLEKLHHSILAVLIPATALVNIFFISATSNSIAKALELVNSHNPVIVATTYSVFYTLPYIISKFFLKKGYYSS